MKDSLIKNIHWILILYIAFDIHTIYDEKSIELTAQEASVKTATIKLNKTKKDLLEIERFNKNLEESKKRVAEVIKNIEKVQRQLPAEINDTEIEQLFSKLSNELRMKDEKTAPKPEQNQGFYFTKEYTIEATGTFLQFLILFEKLENLAQDGRILNVKFSKMTVDETADSRSRFRILKLLITVESFRYNSNYNFKG